MALTGWPPRAWAHGEDHAECRERDIGYASERVS